MSKLYELGKMPQIHIKQCQGDLVIKGSDGTAVQVKGDETTVTPTDTGLIISSTGQLRLTLPAATQISGGRIQGDAVIKNVTGQIELGDIAGDAVLAHTHSVQMETVMGDVAAKDVSGPLTINNIHGDAVLRGVADMTLGMVRGDLTARGVNGSAHLGEVMGDVNLRQVAGRVSLKTGHRDANLRFLAGETAVGEIHGDIRLVGELTAEEHSFTAHGDIIMRWPVTTPLTLKATGPHISHRLPLEEVVETETSLQGHIGKGGPVVNLVSNGRIILKELHLVREEWENDQGDEPEADFDVTLDLVGLGAQISAQVNQQMARLQAELESKLGADFSQRLTEKIARKAEKAAERAGQAAERARQRAERRPSPPPRPTPPPPPRPALSAVATTKTGHTTQAAGYSRRAVEGFENGGTRVNYTR